MKTILVPTDFSECSAAAYNYAVLVAEKTKATICLLHILDIPVPSLSGTNGRETTTDTHFMMEMMQLTKSRMGKVRNSKIFKNAEVQEVIEVGSVPAKILDAVKKYKADMIVMGTHGTNGLNPAFVGTNAEKVVRDSEIPVFTVKHADKDPEIQTIVFATDFSKETEDVLPAVTRIADLFNAKLILTKIITPDRFESTIETEKQIESFRIKSGLYNYSTQIYYARDKEEGIRRAATALGADLIALGTHGRHGLAHLFKGSIAEDVVKHASLPVLTVNFHKKLIKTKTAATSRKQKQYESDFLYQIPSV